MNLSDFDYDLPHQQIAQHPSAERDSSRMLVVDRAQGTWSDRQFRELPDILTGAELMVVNNARVLPARLFGHRAGIHAAAPGPNNPDRGRFLKTPIEVLLVRELAPGSWQTLVRPGRKVPVGETIIFGDGELKGHVEGRGDYGVRIMRFSSTKGFGEALDQLGHIPLPPYIKRPDEPIDRERYQTVYAQQGSAVAAPTAGLHFTREILGRLHERQIEIAEITLDVGLGTFEPIRTLEIDDHKIHAESYEISESAASAIAKARREKRPVLAIGTTVVRALEDSAEKSGGNVVPGKSEARIFLLPGKPFRIVNQLLTNFHLPQSSLVALVAAFAGREQVLRAYRHAVEAGYRFYSYGDCMFLR